jgi:K+-transporting ATPase ATPase C chain
LTLVFAVVTGLVYSLALTGIIQAVFPSQANGGLITHNGQVVGSSLIGQQFTSERYFHGRVSATKYAADNSAGSNLAPSNPALIDRVASSARAIRAENGLPADAPIPVDLVTADFSGIDPNISEAGALIQIHRIAAVRGLNETKMRSLVENRIQGRILWLFGEPHLNVLELNLARDQGAAG